MGKKSRGNAAGQAGTSRFMQALLGVTLAAHANPPPAVPEDAKRAKDLYSQFINKGKRAKAWKELDALLKAKPCSALCITAAKMHMIAAVEQVCKCEEDAAREAAALEAMHRVLEFAAAGALRYASIQCLVLAVFTLHTCRGRGTPEQLAWRRAQAAALGERFWGPAGSASRWAKTKWVDPRVESYDKDRFPFEWEPYSSKNLKEWIEAVRDDWNKFMPTIAAADQLAAEQHAAQGSQAGPSAAAAEQQQQEQQQQQLGAAAGAGRDDAAESLQEAVGTPVDARLAASFALKHCDKDAVRRHLDAIEAKRKPAGGSSLAVPPPLAKPAPTPASTRAGRAATAAAAAAVVQLAAAAGKEDRALGSTGPLPSPSTPAPYSRGGGLAESSLLLPHQGGGGGKGRERHRAEQKRQQAQRAQQRAVEIQAFLAQQLAAAGEDPEAAQRVLAEQCCMPVAEFTAALKAAVAAREISQAEADLALANLERLRGEEGVPPRHVWYGDPHLDVPSARHEAECQEEMESLLADHLQQDWMAAEESTEWVGAHLDGWRELLTRMGLDSNTMTDVDRDSMLAQEDPSLGEVLVRVWTEDYSVAPPPGAEEDEAADAEVEALLPAGARPCTCGRCQREQQQQPPAPAAAPAPSSEEAGRAGAGEACGEAGAGGEAGAAGSTAASHVCSPPGEAAGPPNAAYGGAEPCQADGVAGSSSPSRVQLAQQQWREAMHSEEYGSVLQLDVYINEAERSQQYLDSILGRPEGLMQQCRVLAANPEGAPSNEADELVRRAVVGHLMLRLAGAWEEPSPALLGEEEGEGTVPCAAEGCCAGHSARSSSDGSRSAAQAATPAAAAAGGLVGGVAETLHLLRRAMDPSCDLESLIMDCAVDEEAGRSAVQKLGQLREAELAAEAAASKAWAELSAAYEQQGGTAGALPNGLARGGGVVGGGSAAADAAAPAAGSAAGAPGEGGVPVEAREDDGAISRPVTFCTPLLTTVLEGVAGGLAASGGSEAGGACGSTAEAWQHERQRLLRVKGQLARSALLGLGQIWRRRRLTDKMSFQLCQFIADSLATCGELSGRPAERDVLRRAAERLLVGPAPAPCVLRLAGWLPLRVLRHLYTFVVLLVGECFASPQDLSEEIEDLVYADASAGALAADGSAITVRPAVFAALTPVPVPGAQGFADALAPELTGKKRAGRPDLFGPQPAAFGCGGEPGCEGEGAAPGGSNWLARVAAYVCAPSEAQQAQQAQQESGREEVVGDLHKLWHVEGVLLGLANLCEYWERGLDDSLARMETLRAALEQIAAGAGELPGLGDPSGARGPFVLEQQLLEARKVLQATESVELSLRLAVIKMHGVCFDDVLRMLREHSSELGIQDEACIAAAINKFECMLRDSQAEGDACRERMKELAAAPAPALGGKELETVRALGLVLGAAPAGQNGARAGPHKIRALLAARPERWDASLAAGRDLVLATLRRLDECTEALATLGEWCYIKQCSLIGQLRSQYCTHSCGDEIVGVLLRLLATQRWEPAILAEQERERSALAEQLQSELEAERERRAQAKAAKRAQKAKQRAAATAAAAEHEQSPEADAPAADATANGHGASAADDSSGSSSSSSEDEAEEQLEPSASAAAAKGWVAEILARQQPRPAAPAGAAAAAPAAAPAAAQQPKPAAAKPAKQQQQAAAKAPPPPREVMRVVSYLGDWLCSCGRTNKLWDACACKQEAPCRDWVRGVCSLPQCRFPHPPFDLPATTTVKKANRIANPAPGAPMYGKQPAASAAPAAKQAAAAQRAAGGARPAAAAAAMAPAAPAPASRPLGSAGSSSSSLTSAGGALHDPPSPACGAWGLPPVQQQQQPAVPSGMHQPADSQPAAPRAPQSFAAAVAGVQAADGSWPPLRGNPPPVQQPAQPSGAASSRGSAPASGRVSPAVPPAAVAAAPPAATIGGGGPGPPLGGALAALPQQPGASAAAAAAFAAPLPGVLLPPAPPAALAPAPLLPLGLPPSLLDAPSLGVQPPAAAAWGSQGLALPQQQQQQQPEEEEEAGAGDAGEAAIFSVFDSQVLEGLGLGGLEEEEDTYLASPAQPQPQPQPAVPPLQPPPQQQPAAVPAASAAEVDALLSALAVCLWQCSEFREQVLRWQAPVYMGHPVVRALYSLFQALAQQQAGPGWEPLGSLQAGELREALEALPGQLLCAGGACDAAAVLGAVYGRIQEVAAMRGILSLADAIFGLPVVEWLECGGCGRITQRRELLTYHLVAQADVLRERQRALGGAGTSLGLLLRSARDQSKLPCDQRTGGCGALCSVGQSLQQWGGAPAVPRVFTFRLEWGPMRQEAPADIEATLCAVEEQMDLSSLYQELAPGRARYQLCSLFCTSQGCAAHQAIVWAPSRGGWLLLGETRASSMATWADVRQRCAEHSMRPQLLFFELQQQ